MIFSKICSAFSKLHFKRPKNLAENEEKTCSTFLNPFLHGIFKTQNPGLGYPIKLSDAAITNLYYQIKKSACFEQFQKGPGGKMRQ